MKNRIHDPRTDCPHISCIMLGPCPELEHCLGVLNQTDPHRKTVQDAIENTREQEK